MSSCYIDINRAGPVRGFALFFHARAAWGHPARAPIHDKEVHMTRYNVWLNCQGLQDVDPAIRITDVQEQEPQQLHSASPLAAGGGRHVLRHDRQQLAVTVFFSIRERDPARRSSILQKVKAWAHEGGTLTLSQRPGQRLRVLGGQAGPLSALRWTQDLSLTFMTSRSAFWEDDIPTQADASSPLSLPGDASDTPLDLRWRCTVAGPLTLTVTTPLSSITFCDLPAAAGQELLLSHESGVLTASMGGSDVLPFRTPESSDDLLLACGRRSVVTVTVNGAPVQDCILSARGRWL